MKSKNKKKVVPYSKIQLLNLPEKETGAYIAVNLRGRYNDNSFNNSEYQVKISDCNNSILLHGSLSNPLSIKNAMYKIDNLIETLTEFKQNMIEQLKENRLNIKG